MDLITKAVKDVMYNIPRELLRVAYMEDRVSPYIQSPRSLEEAIREKTIIPRVVADTDLIGGQTIYVPLAGITPKIMDDDNFIFEIPAERTGNRKIISVLAVNYFRSENIPAYQNSSAPMVAPMLGSELSMSAQRAMNSRGSIPLISTAECIVVGHNVVMIRNHLRTAAMTQLKCRVENDQNLANLPLTVFPIFSKLCIFAVKAYIYNELIIKIDAGVIHRGHQLGVFKNTVESYADANENYATCRDEEWGAVTVMADAPVFAELIKTMLDPSI